MLMIEQHPPLTTPPSNDKAHIRRLQREILELRAEHDDVRQLAARQEEELKRFRMELARALGRQYVAEAQLLERWLDVKLGEMFVTATGTAETAYTFLRRYGVRLTGLLLSAMVLGWVSSWNGLFNFSFAWLMFGACLYAGRFAVTDLRRRYHEELRARGR